MADTPAPEIGHAQISLWDGTTELDFNLQGVQAARTWSRLLREDDKCAEVYQALTLPIRRAAWQVDPNGAPNHIVARVAGDGRKIPRRDDPPVADQDGGAVEHAALGVHRDHYGVAEQKLFQSTLLSSTAARAGRGLRRLRGGRDC